MVNESMTDALRQSLELLALNCLSGRGIVAGKCLRVKHRGQRQYEDGTVLRANWVVEFERTLDPCELGPYLILVDAETLKARFLPSM
jgi:hypothetical protein